MTFRSHVAARRGPHRPDHAAFAPRLLAWLIDLAGLWILYSILVEEIVGVGFNFLLYGAFDLSLTADSPTAQLWRILAVGVVIVALAVVLIAAFLCALRATPGQRLVGLLTLDSQSGLQVSWPQAIGRSLMLYGPWMALLAVPPYLALGLDAVDLQEDVAWARALPWVVRALAVTWFLALAVTSRAADGRGFHDLASRSVVVRRMP